MRLRSPVTTPPARMPRSPTGVRPSAGSTPEPAAEPREEGGGQAFGGGGLGEEAGGAGGFGGAVEGGEGCAGGVGQGLDLGGAGLLEVELGEVESGEGGVEGVPVFEEAVERAAEVALGGLGVAQAAGDPALEAGEAVAAPQRSSQRS
jgi:hypothetical protein